MTSVCLRPSDITLDLNDDEIGKVREILGREPNTVEWAMIDIMWSEHCSYKSSRPVLKLLPREGERILVGPGQDAGVVDIGDGLAVVFKIESHNHPSAVDPYNGAATGIGGIIRDILCMGARPIALIDPLRFGLLDNGHTKWLLKYVVKGIGDYGNCIGVPTVGGEVEFDPNFEKNCLVNVGCLGVTTHDKIIPSKAGNPGDYVVLMGGSTGRDGIHGVTFASKELSGESEEDDRGSVQIGDPFTKKKIIDATLEAIETGFVKGLKDLGGGGLTCGTSEMAEAAGVGLEINLDEVYLREPDMDTWEIVISESQERMLFIIDPEGLNTVTDVFEKYELPYALIGKVTDTGRLVMSRGGNLVVDLPPSILTKVPTIDRESQKPSYVETAWKVKRPSPPKDIAGAIYALLGSPNIGSKEWIYQQYDHEVGVRTVVKPGKADAAVLRVLGKKKGIAIAADCNSRHVYLDPYNGGLEAVVEACRNVTSVGAEPVGMVDCCNFGNPEDPEIFWQFKEAVRGMADACKFLKVPCVGGNVSFYNEDTVTGIAIKPAPVVMAVGLMEDVEKAVTMEFKQPGEKIVIVGETLDEVEGSEYYAVVHKIEGGKPSRTDLLKEKRTMHAILEVINKGYITASHDCSRGGLAVALSLMCLKGGLGADVDLDKVPIPGKIPLDSLLFSETNGRYILSVRKNHLREVLDTFEKHEVKAGIIGEVKKYSVLNIKDEGNIVVSCSLSKLYESFFQCLIKEMEAA
ncbi:MAG: phosphoribosylformylglycinamidine synthase subunit PurL [Candidatus Hodarchaeota archaeon]